MPPAIYIHMGQHKTGTTSAQHFCHRYREELKTQLGLYYPVSPTAPCHRHPGLFPFNTEIWRDIRREMDVSGCTRLLISNEGWYGFGVSDKDIAAVREIFPESEIYFVLYLRRLDDYCKSWYNERLKSGAIRQPGYAGYWDFLKRQSPRLHPTSLLQKCERQVGRKNLIVRIYDLGLLKNGDIIDDLFGALGMVLPDSLEKDQRRNLSLPNAAIPYMTDTLIRTPKRDALRKELRRKMSSAFSRQDEGGINEALLAGLEEEIELLDTRYLPGYKKLFEKRKCDLSFPELKASPKDVLIVDLLYTILFELRRQQQQSFSHRLASFVGKLARPFRKRLSVFQNK